MSDAELDDAGPESIGRRVALVTGAASGVGRAVAQRYLRSGIDVVAFDVDSAGLEKVAVDATEFAGEIRTVDGDVRDRTSMEAAVEVAESSFGGLDIVAAIAGITRVGPVHEMSDADRDLVLGVNLIGVWNSIAAAVPALLRRGPGGRILVCGSVESVLGGSGLSAYVASKHGLIGLVKSVALELATTGITANMISPAGVDTDLLRAIVPPDQIDHIARTTPIPRLSTPDEVAAFFEFLAGAETAYMTGENVIIDGGLKLVNAHTAGESWAEG